MEFRNAKSFLGECIATFFFVGRSPKAPGTCGSLAALPFAWFLWQMAPLHSWILIAAVFFLGVWGASIVIERTKVSDHQSIVIDEVLGIFITTSVCSQVWWHFAAAFVLFRIFDIGKPWPVSWVDKNWKGALGTIVDDIVAAVMATVILYIFLYFFGGGIGVELTPA